MERVRIEASQVVWRVYYSDAESGLRLSFLSRSRRTSQEFQFPCATGRRGRVDDASGSLLKVVIKKTNSPC
jgi:hypothetical protein